MTITIKRYLKAYVYLNRANTTEKDREFQPKGNLPIAVEEFFRNNPDEKSFTESRDDTITSFTTDKAFDKGYKLISTEKVREENGDFAIVIYERDDIKTQDGVGK